jgi:MoxR-like ATPase
MTQATATVSTNTRQSIERVQHYLNQKILGQTRLLNRLLIALLADGHLLVEGAPGLAKTKAVKSLSHCLEGKFHRIQFTPDLLPADITGTDVFQPQSGTFHFQPGPIFHNIVLADEINRAPAKVQSALLEAMEERQVSIGQQTYPLPDLFLVMATQNPLEQEGTYPLPEAQLDRFLMHTKVNYPDAATELQILQQQTMTTPQPAAQAPQLSLQTVFTLRQEIARVHLSPALETYIVQLVLATRDPKPYSAPLKQWIQFGASPRGTLALARCAKAHAWLHQRDYVSPEDIQLLCHDVLRHRIILSFEAEANGINTDHVIDELLQQVAVP